MAHAYLGAALHHCDATSDSLADEAERRCTGLLQFGQQREASGRGLSYQLGANRPGMLQGALAHPRLV